MNKLKLENYNLSATLLGGQSFGWENEDNKFVGFTNDKIVLLKYKDNHMYWQTYPEKDNDEFISTYFRLDLPYNDIISKISKDAHIKRAILAFPNLRLLQQDFEETLLSFILSANNNIKSIRRSIRKLNMLLGEKVTVKDKSYYLFPKTYKIAEASMETLLSTSIGFRAKYLKAAAQRLVNSNISSQIQHLSEKDARSKLVEFNGVGDKIADCVLCFSLGFNNVTPIDVWAKRVATDLYGLNKKIKYKEASEFFDNYFEGYAAFAGQFLFEYIRSR